MYSPLEWDIVGHENIPEQAFVKARVFSATASLLEHLYWCTWLNLRQGWHMQSSHSPIVSLNTNQHAPATRCCEQIAEYWARLSRPQASLGQFLFRFRKSIEGMALAGRSRRSTCKTKLGTALRRKRVCLGLAEKGRRQPIADAIFVHQPQASPPIPNIRRAIYITT